MDALYIFLGVH